MPLGLTPEAAASLGEAWAALTARALEPSVFNDPAFALPAALHLPQGRRCRILTAWHPDDPSRLIGLCCVAAPVPGLPLSAWLHPQATAAFPLLDAACPAAALADLLAQSGGWLRPAGLLMHGLAADGATMRLLGSLPTGSFVPVAERRRAVLRHMPPVPTGKAGKEFRRQARRLGEHGRVAFGVVSDLHGMDAALDSFLRLEAQGWKGRRGTALAQEPRLARFTRSMVSGLAASGRCSVHSITLDGRPVAMGLVLRSGPTAFFWKTGFDEAFARFSPGAHLAEAIGRHQAGQPGITLTDSCAIPGHAMIDRLWPERMTVVDAIVAPQSRLSVAMRAALQAELARRTLRAHMARLVTTLRRQTARVRQ